MSLVTGKSAAPKNQNELLCPDERVAKPVEPDRLFDALTRLEKALDEGTLNAAPAAQGRPAPPGGGSSPKITDTRRALIRQALATQRDKAKVLGDLSPDDRLRLHLMAKKLIMPGKK